MTALTSTKAKNAGYSGHNPPYARQTFPGQPIELLWGDERVNLSDSQALFLAYQLIKMVLGNDQAKVRANAN